MHLVLSCRTTRKVFVNLFQTIPSRNPIIPNFPVVRPDPVLKAEPYDANFQSPVGLQGVDYQVLFKGPKISRLICVTDCTSHGQTAIYELCGCMMGYDVSTEKGSLQRHASNLVAFLGMKEGPLIDLTETGDRDFPPQCPPFIRLHSRRAPEMSCTLSPASFFLDDSTALRSELR